LPRHQQQYGKVFPNYREMLERLLICLKRAGVARRECILIKESFATAVKIEGCMLLTTRCIIV